MIVTVALVVLPDLPSVTDASEMDRLGNGGASLSAILTVALAGLPI